MEVPICRHIKSNGLQCRGVALNGSVFCYFHRNLNRAHDLYRDKATLQRHIAHTPFLKLPPLEDRESIQIAISTVVHALATGCITERHAYALLKGIRLALDACRGIKPVRRPTQMVREVEKEAWTTIPEANPDLAPEGQTRTIPDAATSDRDVAFPPHLVILNEVKDPCISDAPPNIPVAPQPATTNLQLKPPAFRASTQPRYLH